MSYVSKIKYGTDHTLWVRGLEFYRDELEIMNKQLPGISEKIIGDEAAKEVEHFQNQFFIQQKNISDLRHQVNNYVKGLSHHEKTHEGHVDSIFITRGEGLRQSYERLELIMNSLRREFNEFLSKWT